MFNCEKLPKTLEKEENMPADKLMRNKTKVKLRSLHSWWNLKMAKKNKKQKQNPHKQHLGNKCTRCCGQRLKHPKIMLLKCQKVAESLERKPVVEK